MRKLSVFFNLEYSRTKRMTLTDKITLQQLIPGCCGTCRPEETKDRIESSLFIDPKVGQ